MSYWILIVDINTISASSHAEEIYYSLLFVVIIHCFYSLLLLIVIIHCYYSLLLLLTLQ